MLKKFVRIAGGIIIASTLITAIACNDEVLPTGDLVSQGGAPGGGTLGGGGGKATFPVFDINNMPAPKFWNDNGHYDYLPDLFTFANGKKVTTAEDWLGPKGRRWEIEQILQHYEYGYMPPYGNELTVSWNQISSTALRIDLSYTGPAGVKTANFTINADIPSGSMPEGGYPAIIECGSGGAGGWNIARDGRYAKIGYNVDNAAAESDHAGMVTDLFGYNYSTDLNAPSIFMAYAWGVGRIIDALETEIESKKPFDGKIDPNKLMITGMSRWGKGAEISAAFSKSKKGTQIAVLDIGSAGSGGPALERFISPLGLHEDHSLTVAQAGTQSNIPGRIYYIQFIGGNEGNTLIPGVGGDTSWFTSHPNDSSQPPYDGPVGTDLSSGSGGYPLVVKAITRAEYDTLSADASKKNTVFKYDYWPNESIYNGNYWHGLETLAQLIHGSPTWFNGRFKQFKDLHFGLRCDDVGGLPTRTPDGFLCTIPYDQHFLLALIAPRAVIIHDGFRTVRNNPEGCFLNHLAVDEVYKFLGEQGVKPAFAQVSGFDDGVKLEEFNAIKYYHIPHAQPEYEIKDTIDLADVYFGFKTRESISEWGRLRAAPYPVTDPRSKHDYQKLNWARPGATALSEQVKDVPDYDWAGHKLAKWD